MYITMNGNEVTAAQIKKAFVDGKAVLVHGRSENHTSTSLMLNGEHFDTRGQCHSMWDEAWTTIPENAEQCIQIAYCKT